MATAPTASDWIEWSGGECPVNDMARVRLRLGDESVERAEADNPTDGLPAHFFARYWPLTAGSYRIAAYQVVG